MPIVCPTALSFAVPDGNNGVADCHTKLWLGQYGFYT